MLRMKPAVRLDEPRARRKIPRQKHEDSPGGRPHPGVQRARAPRSFALRFHVDEGNFRMAPGFLADGGLPCSGAGIRHHHFVTSGRRALREQRRYASADERILQSWNDNAYLHRYWFNKGMLLAEGGSAMVARYARISANSAF